MNRMLVVIFSTQTEAYAGVRALRQLEAEGSLVLYGLGVVARDASGAVSVLERSGPDAVGVGVGMAVGAVAGTLAGAARDSWVSGLGLDLVDETQTRLQPGKVAIVAEVDEDWIVPIDTQMAAAGGVVFRHARSDVEASVGEPEQAVPMPPAVQVAASPGV